MLADFLMLISRWAIPLLLLCIPLVGIIKRVNIYDAFVDGAAAGFETAVGTIPYMVAMFVSIKVFRASGAMEMLGNLLSGITSSFGIPPDIFPLALIRPFSGGAALGVSAELIQNHGPDSLTGRLASVMLGSNDTTFYVLTIYFASLGIKRYRYAPVVGLIADLTTFAASVYIVNKLFA